MKTRIAFSVILLAVIAAGFTAFYLAEGFIPWQGVWWQWLVQYYLHYGALPASALWSLLAILLASLIGGIAVTISRINPNASTLSGGVSGENLHGSAKWAKARDIKAAGLDAKEGVTVGGYKNAPLRHDGPEHILAFAPTRSGKGVSLVLPTLLEWQDSAIILDIKGENYALTAGYRKSIGQRVLRFDPTAPQNSIRFNPLAEVRIGTDYELQDCQNISSMIIDPDGKGLKDFWMQSGFEWLSAAILHVLYRVKIEKRRTASLFDVNQMLSATEHSTAEDPVEALLDAMIAFDHDDRKSVNDEVRRVATKMKGRAGPERSGVHSSSMTQLGLYGDPIVAKNVAASDFSINDLMNGDVPTSLYIIIPPSDIDRLRPLVRVIFNIFLRKLTAKMDFENGSSVKGYKHRLLLMLDEFTAIGKLEIFEKALAFMAGYGLKCFIIVQDLTQLQQAYGKEESIMSNCHIRIAFAPNKFETAKTLSDMLGTKTVIQRKSSTSGSVFKKSHSFSLLETSRPLITPNEVMALSGAEKNRKGEVTKPGAMIILAAGFRPIFGEQRLYFKDKDLLKRAKMPPPQNEALPVLTHETPPAEAALSYSEDLDKRIANAASLNNPASLTDQDAGAVLSSAAPASH